MSVLRSIESKLESLFEGVFGRAFRTNVQPVELARKLTKEMDDHRTVSVSRVYVPNEYTVYLAPGDREQFADYEAELCEELADYLAEHARRESYALATPPAVKIETDDDLGIGVFGIATRTVQTGHRQPDEPSNEGIPGATMVYRPVVEPAAAPPSRPDVAYVEWEGRRTRLERERLVIGRSKDCDIQLSDPNVSRRHAEVRAEGADHWLVDLDSTNGIEVGGKRVRRLKLEPGTRFSIGSTELTFGREPQ
jgi:hypothetical protein